MCPRYRGLFPTRLRQVPRSTSSVDAIKLSLSSQPEEAVDEDTPLALEHTAAEAHVTRSLLDHLKPHANAEGQQKRPARAAAPFPTPLNMSRKRIVAFGPSKKTDARFFPLRGSSMKEQKAWLV